MYKIYINEVPVTFCHSKDIDEAILLKGSKLIFEYKGRIKRLKKIIQLCEETNCIDTVIIHSKDLESLQADFQSLHYLVEAAGGLIRNEYKEVLGIFRRAHWDLPKGKIDKGESKREAALREVKEETGIKSVYILDKITVSYHTFTGKSGKKILKKTHWYLMEAPKQKLIPQINEDIEIAEWIKLNDFKKKESIYGNILQTVKEYESMLIQ